MRKIVLIVGVLISLMLWCSNSSAQFIQHNYIEVGKTNASGGIYLDAASLSAIRYKHIHAELGFLFPLTEFDKFLSTFYASAGVDFKIKNLPVEIHALFTDKLVSEFISELQFGIIAGVKTKHVHVFLGNNTRLFNLTRNAIEQSRNDNYRKLQIVEKLNLMYSLSYLVFPQENKWNIIASVLNYDYFLIHQETNPFVSVRFTYNPRENIGLYSEIVYKSAGFNNIQVNYFGINLLTGILWEIDF